MSCVVPTDAHAGRLLPPDIHAFLSFTPHFTFLTMASASTSRHPDVEAQRDVLRPHRASYHLTRYCPLGWIILTIFGKELGEDDIYEMKNRPSEVVSDAGRAPADLAHSVVSESQAIGATHIPPHPGPSLAFQVRLQY